MVTKQTEKTIYKTVGLDEKHTKAHTLYCTFINVMIFLLINAQKLYRNIEGVSGRYVHVQDETQSSGLPAARFTRQSLA